LPTRPRTALIGIEPISNKDPSGPDSSDHTYTDSYNYQVKLPAPASLDVRMRSTSWLWCHQKDTLSPTKPTPHQAYLPISALQVQIVDQLKLNSLPEFQGTYSVGRSFHRQSYFSTLHCRVYVRFQRLSKRIRYGTYAYTFSSSSYLFYSFKFRHC